jgi:hypothetical protein
MTMTLKTSFHSIAVISLALAAGLISSTAHAACPEFSSPNASGECVCYPGYASAADSCVQMNDSYCAAILGEHGIYSAAVKNCDCSNGFIPVGDNCMANDEYCRMTYGNAAYDAIRKLCKCDEGFALADQRCVERAVPTTLPAQSQQPAASPAVSASALPTPTSMAAPSPSVSPAVEAPSAPSVSTENTNPEGSVSPSGENQKFESQEPSIPLNQQAQMVNTLPFWQRLLHWIFFWWKD